MNQISILLIHKGTFDSIKFERKIFNYRQKNTNTKFVDPKSAKLFLNFSKKFLFFSVKQVFKLNTFQQLYLYNTCNE